MSAVIEQLKSLAHADASTSLEAIERQAWALAKQMQEIHGGEWRVQIDHQYHFALVAMRHRT